jgi:GxxExxY protein
VIGAAITVHRSLGPGLLESAYQACLAHELCKRGVAFEREVQVPVVYDGVQIECGYRMDLLVADAVVVEIKCVAEVLDIHLAQLLTYLRLSGKERGLLINFNEVLLKDGLYRRALSARNTASRSASSASLR